MIPHMINHLVSSAFAEEQKSDFKFELNNDLTWSHVIQMDHLEPDHDSHP